MRVCLDDEVRAAHRRPEIGARGRYAAPVANRDLVVPDTFLRFAIEVGVAGNPGFDARAQKRTAQRMRVGADVRDGDGSSGAAQRALAVRAVLELPEVRQHVAPAPARIAERFPSVVVLGLAAHEDHGVDRARAAEELAARPVAGPSGERGLGLGAVHPVDARLEEALAVADRHLHPETLVAAARFEQQHAVASARGQPVGEHAARGARAHDDVIECVQHFGRSTREGNPRAWSLHALPASRRRRYHELFGMNLAASRIRRPSFFRRPEWRPGRRRMKIQRIETFCNRVRRLRPRHGRRRRARAGAGVDLQCRHHLRDPAPAGRAVVARARRARHRRADRPHRRARAQVPRLLPVPRDRRARHRALGPARQASKASPSASCSAARRGRCAPTPRR